MRCAGEVEGPAAAQVETHPGAFANPAVRLAGWYVAARSRVVKRRPVGIDRLGRRLVAWRDGDGTAHVWHAACPHLGADLSQGCVDQAGTLRCPLHHWRFGRGGACVEAPGLDALPDRRAGVLPACESHGLVWFANTAADALPGFRVPAPPEPARAFRRVVLPAQTLACHPHLVVGNGLDASHFEALHGMVHERPPVLETVDDHTLRLRLRGRPASAWVRRLTGTARRPLEASFTTIGGHLAVAAIDAPVRCVVLFTGAPTADGGCLTRTVLYLPRGWGPGEARSVLLMLGLLRDDRRVLESMRFHRGFTDADAPLRLLAERLDAAGVGAW